MLHVPKSEEAAVQTDPIPLCSPVTPVTLVTVTSAVRKDAVWNERDESRNETASTVSTVQTEGRFKRCDQRSRIHII